MPIYDEEFNKSVNEAISKEDKIFENFSEVDCRCVENFGYCACTNKERACRYLSKIKSDERFFNNEQRELVIVDTDWCGEGSFSREELEKMNDVELASSWLQAAHDYATSQM